MYDCNSLFQNQKLNCKPRHSRVLAHIDFIPKYSDHHIVSQALVVFIPSKGYVWKGFAGEEWISYGRTSWAYCRELSTNSNFSLAADCRLYQTEVSGSKGAVNPLFRRTVFFIEEIIHSDSSAGIVLSSLTESSRPVNKCLTSLSVASSYLRIRLVCVLGDSGIAGNCKTHAHSRLVTSVSLSVEWEQIRAPLANSSL